jgi:hypothetical protein
MLGYAAKEYARSFANFGEPLELRRSGGWLLARALPDESGRDAMGCYPLFCCMDWERLRDDLQDLPAEIVAVSLVADPAADVALAALQESFPDVCYHYKDHYFADLSQPLESFVASHHQRNARQAAKSLRVERLENPANHLTTWNEHYGQLIERHDIRGQATFSPAAFQQQFTVPGLRAYAAFAHDEIVGMVLWMVNETTAYYHLAAYSDAGYELKASFAIFWHSLEAFAAEGIGYAGLGGGAGTFAASEGLSRFKQGWSSETRPAYLCGRILDRARYAELTARSGNRDGSAYFPAYRAPALKNAA